MAYDAIRQEVVLYGGLSASATYLNDTWVYKAATGWTQKCANCLGSGGRRGHAMAWDPVSGRVISFGGNQGASYSNELWAWDGVVWTQRCTASPCLATKPSARSAHAMAHAASAFFTSPFERALCFVADSHALGPSAVAMVGRGTRLERFEERTAPDGLGALYAAFASYLGLAPGEEHELAMLAAHGDASHHRRFFRKLVQLRRDGIAEVDAELVARLALRDALAPRGALYPRAIVRALVAHVAGSQAYFCSAECRDKALAGVARAS